MTQNKHFKCSLTLEINPVPHRTPTVNRWGTAYKGKRELAYIKDLSTKLNKELENESLPLFQNTPISVSYIFGYMPAKSWTKKKKQEAFDNVYMFKTPDISNVIKSTDDILMLSQIIDDDQWIVEYKDIKMIYTKTPLIQIDIKEI